MTDADLPNMNQVSERYLVQRTPRRELSLEASREQRFRLLYEDHVGRVARFVSRRTPPNDVQDVVSETFLTAWRRFDELPADPVPWLFVTARNLMANRNRSAGRQSALHERLGSGLSWPVERPPSEISEIDQRLLSAIRALPAAEREAFMLVAWDELDAGRASRVAGCSAATFRMRLHRARRRLRREIEPQRPFAPTSEFKSSLEEIR